ncbi:MAG: TIGR03435 family protein [Bryobacteraceae bacterium]
MASIRFSTPTPDGQIHSWMSTDAGVLRYTNVSLRDCIRVAYGVKEFQVQGPDWIESTRFDIVAKLPAGLPESQIPEMLQAMLRERFKLAVHRDTKASAIYALVAVKGAPVLKPADVPAGDEPSPGTDAGARAAVNAGYSVATDESGVHLTARLATPATLAELISRFAQHPVIDMTGLQGRCDFDVVLSWETVRDMRAEGGSIYDSLQRYGLKLELRKAPLEVLMVDHIEKMPTEN